MQKQVTANEIAEVATEITDCKAYVEPTEYYGVCKRYIRVLAEWRRGCPPNIVRGRIRKLQDGLDELIGVEPATEELTS